MADHTTYGLVCSELSEDLSKTNLGELKLDTFQDNSVQIKIKAASLNFPDLLMTQGKYQNRPNLFDRQINLTEPLYDDIIEVEERVTSFGKILYFVILLIELPLLTIYFSMYS